MQQTFLSILPISKNRLCERPQKSKKFPCNNQVFEGLWINRELQIYCVNSPDPGFGIQCTAMQAMKVQIIQDIKKQAMFNIWFIIKTCMKTKLVMKCSCSLLSQNYAFKIVTSSSNPLSQIKLWEWGQLKQKLKYKVFISYPRPLRYEISF